MKLGPADVKLTGVTRVPTDDWPFLYLREPTIPTVNLRGMVLVAVLSLVILFAFAPVRGARPSGRMFFLGGGLHVARDQGGRAHGASFSTRPGWLIPSSSSRS